MSYSTPVASYSTTPNGTYTTLTGVQSIAVNRGRQRFQDNFPASSCVIELIPANSYAVPLQIGQYIDVRDANSPSSPCYFGGKITDIERSYGIPYNSGTGAAPDDRIRITATGTVGILATNNLTNYVTTTDKAFNVMSAVVGSLGITPIQAGDPPTVLSIPSFTGGALDYLNLAARSVITAIDDYWVRDPNLYIYYYPVGTLGTTQTTFVFTDAGGNIKYNKIDYVSSVQNSFSQVSARTSSLTAVANTGSAPYNTLVYDTSINQQSDLDNIASYLLTTNSQSAPVPFIVQSDTNIYSSVLTLSQLPSTSQRIIGAPVLVQFRGASVYATIQGIQTVFLKDIARVQLYLSPSLGTPFTLNSTAFGYLDTNRLGFP